MIDLHTHTIFSDGTWSIEKLLENAEKNGVTTLAITDHDTVMPHIRLRNIDVKKYFSGRIITGAEFNCVFNGIKIEVLGYDFDIDKIKDWVESQYSKGDELKGFEKEFYEYVNICKKNNIKLSPDLKYDPMVKFPVKILYNDMKNYKENDRLLSQSEWSSSDAMFRNSTSNPNFLLYRDFSSQYPSAIEVANKIRECGGEVFLAHLYLYRLENHLKFLDDLNSAGAIDGVEAYYSSFTSEQISTLKNYCEENNLYMSAGTDCHGDKNPSRKVGIGYGNMNVQEDLIYKWLY